MDPAIWLKNLKSLGIEYVVVTSLRPFPNLTINLQHDDDCFPIERKWLDALALAQPHCIEKKSLGPDFLLYQLKWNEGCPPAANLSPVTQTVVDALDSAANYPCAPSIIKTRRLLPIPHSEFRIPN